jgi:hypothetical protein
MHRGDNVVIANLTARLQNPSDPFQKLLALILGQRLGRLHDDFELVFA